MYAVNSPREVVKSVRAKGFQILTPEEAAHLPPKLAADEVEHQEMYRAFFDKDDALHMNDDALDGKPIQSEATLVRLMATYRWADQIRVRIRRDGREMDLDVPLRRRLAAGSH